MTLTTAFTERCAVEHPIALAPMGGVSGGALAAGVSNGGGLGLVGGGRGALDWLDRELAIVTAETSAPWGVGLLCWAAGPASLERAMTWGPSAVLLSFGDPEPLASMVRAAGVTLIVQVTDLDEARQALDVGADVIVAQGTEAGGHGGGRSTLPFVPAVVDLVAPVPVLAAGGIADGRGVAAALVLGAAGAVIGTRFEVATEALIDAEAAKAILDGSGDDTERGRASDLARSSAWPARYSGRALADPPAQRWRGRDGELADDEAALSAYRDAVDRGELGPPVWAGEGIDLITEPSTATEIIRLLADQTNAALDRVLRARGAA